MSGRMGILRVPPNCWETLKLLKNNPHIFSAEDIPMLVSRELDLRK